MEGVEKAPVPWEALKAYSFVPSSLPKKHLQRSLAVFRSRSWAIKEARPSFLNRRMEPSLTEYSRDKSASLAPYSIRLTISYFLGCCSTWLSGPRLPSRTSFLPLDGRLHPGHGGWPSPGKEDLLQLLYEACELPRPEDRGLPALPSPLPRVKGM